MLIGKTEVFTGNACHHEGVHYCLESHDDGTQNYLIGAGSTIFVKNILGDVFHREALKSAHVALMDIDETRWKSRTLCTETDGLSGASGRITCHTHQKAALQDADFVVVAFQIAAMNPAP
ncbi:Alpha-galactosidase [Salmonella enterica subsp. enterica]|uniref:Alpha-galactosidase n=1 Tax=Salmonella enterica I TaxID=59201 RepID=A0A379WGD1_SALET|nr:Alpha-galactosidase [Salmonella enterica subsp. enterica]